MGAEAVNNGFSEGLDRRSPVTIIPRWERGFGSRPGGTYQTSSLA